MKTPISDFIKEYENKKAVRLHMPGHKGKKYGGDITEIHGADVLYSSKGIIAESQKNAAEMFGSYRTFYSAEGSTLAIKAMLALVTEGKEKRRILAGRNAHKAFIYGCALLDIIPEWIFPDTFHDICTCEITPKNVEEALKKCNELPCAVYITSPDYLGVQTDIEGISKVCRAYEVPLLVDNAHGAYTAFLEKSEHPLHLGADMCCDSAHKTLPVLTGGAYLHISENGKKYACGAQNALALFASTSPSYLILSSLDECNAYFEGDYRKELKETVELTEKAKKQLCKGGYRIIGTEKTKITLCVSEYGYTGFEIEEMLREKKIYCEYADQKHIVFMVTPQNTKEDIEYLVSVLRLIERVKMIKTEPIPAPPFIPKVVTTPRKAMLGEKELVKVKDALHRICASPTVSCPPAIPIVISGEEIDEKAVELFEYYGVTEIEVIK
ncbi:MAG: hypothetical protein E7674_00710 [Ruminococcaceae bacterium]|nr:hypothetical protein [Oscillospiraceae bacterium]